MHYLSIIFSYNSGSNVKLTMALMVDQFDISQRKPAYVRFQNNTCYSIEVNWMNFHNKEQTYCILDPNKFVDINTFSTHSWTFRFANIHIFFLI